MELFRALAVLAEPPTEASGRVADALELGPLPSPDEYTQFFVFELYPYASVYLGPEGMLGGEARDRISGFWRVLGQSPPNESDHLSVMLAFYATLIDLENEKDNRRRHEAWRTTRKAFLWEHLLSWLPIYLSKAADVAPPFYQRWRNLLTTALVEEARKVGRQEFISSHLRELPGLVDPRENPIDDFLQSILTPLRSGIILTRSDLIRASRALALATRIGERKFILRALFTQNPTGMFEWLMGEANSWIALYDTWDAAFSDVAENWVGRVKASIRLLGQLRTDTENIESASPAS